MQKIEDNLIYGYLWTLHLLNITQDILLSVFKFTSLKLAAAATYVLNYPWFVTLTSGLLPGVCISSGDKKGEKSTSQF